MNELPLIEGISVQIGKDGLAAAIGRAGAAYRRKFDRTPTHVSLPGWVEPEADFLFNGALSLGRPTSDGRTTTRHAGTVIVGRPTQGGGAWN